MTAASSSTILITGAASEIGRRVAHRFARRGWFIGIFDPDMQAVQALADELEGSADVFVQTLNPAMGNAVQNAVQAFGEETDGRLDVLVNAAGVMRAGRFEDLDLPVHREILAGNLWAMLTVTHACFPLLRDTSGARVISIASASGLYGTPELASYSAAKAGVRSLTQALNLEWAHHDIHVCDVVPPYVEAPPADEQTALRPRRSLAPTLTADDVADVVEQAVSENRIHWPVGKQFRWIYRLSDVLPAPLVRLLMRYVSGF